MTALSIRAALLLALISSCSDSPAQALKFEHYPAVQNGLTETQTRLDEEAAARPPGQEVDPEQVAGLVSMLANANERQRSLPLQDIRTLGDGAIATLAVIASRADKPEAQRRAALELLAEIASPRAVEHLLTTCERAPEPWVRAQAAWRLGLIGADWVVPRLVYRLKYEMDHETAIWIAASLAVCGNYAGQKALYTVRDQGMTPQLRASAEEQLVTMARNAGASDPEELWNLWNFADPQNKLLRQDPSPRLQRKIWELISGLSGEHFQLRGVDDSRFILARLGAWVTEPLSQALHDGDVYVRVHVAQCLERMGARATGAGPTLVAALTDGTVAPAAATALGEISYPSAEPELRRLLELASTAHDLRVACASALGRIGLSASIGVLEKVLASEAEPADLRQRCAIALCQLDTGTNAAPFLLAAMKDPRADRFDAEVALGSWLLGLEGAKAKQTLAAWTALGQASGTIPTAQEAQARVQRRAALFDGALPDLLAVAP